ncbi:hypothetical protein NE471_28075, partial [Escherichia coli]|nr:hypothetical protein [Escherichia coli]
PLLLISAPSMPLKMSVVSGSIRGETLSLPLQIELLEQDYNTVGSFTAAALLTLMAIITLFLKSMLQWRLENQEKRVYRASPFHLMKLSLPPGR